MSGSEEEHDCSYGTDPCGSAEEGERMAERFRNRRGMVDSHPGFMGFELLKGDGEYVSVTRWASQEALDSWISGEAHGQAHGQPRPQVPQTGGRARVETRPRLTRARTVRVHGKQHTGVGSLFPKAIEQLGGIGDLFTGISVIYLLIGAYILYQLVTRWREFWSGDMSMQNQQLAGGVAFFLLVPVGVLLHEFGHMLAAWSTASKVLGLHYFVYWGYVEYSVSE